MDSVDVIIVPSMDLISQPIYDEVNGVYHAIAPIRIMNDGYAIPASILDCEIFSAYHAHLSSCERKTIPLEVEDELN